jgi:ribosomal protein S27E
MREGEIRPALLVEENNRLHEADVRQLMGNAGRFVQVACPACDSGTPSDPFDKDGFHPVRCTSCDTLYVNPLPDNLDAVWRCEKGVWISYAPIPWPLTVLQ